MPIAVYFIASLMLDFRSNVRLLDISVASVDLYDGRENILVTVFLLMVMSSFSVLIIE